MRPASKHRWMLCALLGSAVLGISGSVWARAEAEVGYTREQVFSAALRYLRVDLAYEVTEKDADAAYLLFSFAAPELERKVARGSIEVIQRQRTVRLLVNLPELPAYREEVLKGGLLEKLVREYGQPPAADDAPEKPPKVPPKNPNGDRKDPPAEDAPEGNGPTA